MATLVDGSRVVISGRVTRAMPPKGTGPGRVTVDDATYGSVATVWWPPLTVPRTGHDVTIHGDVKFYNGQPQVTVDGIPPVIPLSQDGRIVAFLRSCSEAETRADLIVSTARQACLLLDADRIDLDSISGVPIPRTQRAQQWIAARHAALSETVVLGLALVPRGRSNAAEWHPLFVAEVTISIAPGDPATVQSSTLEINPPALEEMGLDSTEIEELTTSLRANVELEDAATGALRLRLMLDTLRDTGILTADEVASISLSSLAPPRPDVRLNNSAALMASSGSSIFTAQMQRELAEIANSDPTFTDGPLAVLFGHQSANGAVSPSVHPIVVETSVRQDLAVASAMTNALTVVTGPPGTGKSQMLTNLVAAAVSRGESVLFASKNNKAVDVVFDRISHSEPEIRVLRAGPASQRSALATAIEQAIESSTEKLDSAAIEAEQLRIDTDVQRVYERIREYSTVLDEIRKSTSDLEQRRRDLGVRVSQDFEVERLAAAIDDLVVAMNGLREPLPWFRRWRRQAIQDQRIETADIAFENLQTNFRESGDDLKSIITPSLIEIANSASWRRVAAKDARDLPNLLQKITEIQLAESKLRDLERQRDAFDIAAIEDQIQQLNPERMSAGRASIRSSKRHQLMTAPNSIASAQLLIGNISTAAAGGTGALAAKKLLPMALPVLPAWGVTNLSVGTTFPLQRGLFDLVVIDEASQCDLASAIPLLYRAKRAVIIGDPRQLTHITSIGPAREAHIAQMYELTEDQQTRFSYRAQSLYLAAEHRFGSPVFLNLHFRSRSGIIQFSNEAFYNQRLEICSEIERDGRPSVSWTDVSSDCARPAGRGSWFNRREAEEVVATLRRLSNNGVESIGVVTPYRAQSEMIVSLLLEDDELKDRKITVATAHKFQGDERDHIIYSPVVGPSLPPSSLRFAADPNLLNVALTRARQELHIVGNRSACRTSGGLMTRLVEYVDRISDSVFDSPLELRLHDALHDAGIDCSPRMLVAGHRCDLAVTNGAKQIDIECDGRAFHRDLGKDLERDQVLRSLGWTVMRFSGREISGDLQRCVDRVREELRS